MAEPVITLLIGPGNNGGDGWVIARHLEAWGIKTACWLFGTEERLSADNRANYQILQRAGSNITYMDKMPRIIALDLLQRHLHQSYIIVDTLLGTGSTGAPREPMSDAIRLANQADVWRIAIDLPTGLDADTGIATEPTFRAHWTLTMVTQKLGFKNPQAAEFLGEVRVLPIGIPALQLQNLCLG
jgi:NAD(P)H-hydrate epimerase